MFIRKVSHSFCINIIGNKFSTSSIKNFKVCCVGAAGGIGQPLSLLLKLNPYVTQLSLFDVANVEGVALDLSHIETVAKVTANQELNKALKDSDIVVIPAGVPRKPGMTRDDLFNTNCKIMEGTVTGIATACPKALIAIITNPVNSIVPLAAEVLTQKGVYEKNRLFGVTTLDLVRARSFISQILKVNPCAVDIPVIGGHAGTTILPIISQCKPELKLSDELTKKLIVDIQDAGTEVVKAKKGAGSATLSMAYAGSSFVNTLLHGLKGQDNVKTYSYVENDLTEAKFFSTLVTFGKCGVEDICDLPKLNDREKEQVDAAVKQLQAEIQKGIDFVKKNGGKKDKKKCP